jgi:hypothetical protein
MNRRVSASMRNVLLVRNRSTNTHSQPHHRSRCILDSVEYLAGMLLYFRAAMKLVIIHWVDEFDIELMTGRVGRRT